MRRPLRILLNVATVLALLCFAVEAFYWLTRSHSYIAGLHLEISWQYGYYLTFPLKINVPHWMSFWILNTVLAAQLGARWHRTMPQGCCRACGYDLRATPDRCPECGTVPDAVSPDPSPRIPADESG